MIGISVNLVDMCFIQDFKSSDGSAPLERAAISQIAEHFIVLDPDIGIFPKADRHTKFGKICYRSLDSGQGKSIFILALKSPDIPGKTCKAGGLCRIDSQSPGLPNSRKRSTVGGAEHGGQFMAELMNGEVSGAAKSGQAVVGKRAGPHQFAHGIIIVGVSDSDASFSNYCAQKRLGNRIGQLIVNRIEITVKSMHHDIGYAAGHLIEGKCIS